MIRFVGITLSVLSAGCSGGGQDTAVEPAEDIAGDVTVTVNGESFTLAYAPAGTFEMGSPESEEGRDDDETQHTVTLSEGFYISTTEVTQALYETVIGDNPSRNDGRDKACATCPVETVSWFDAVAFCNALSELEDLDGAYSISGEDVTLSPGASGYRLPTDAEWEYAARAGEAHLYSGSDDVDEVAWYSENSGDQTHPVGEKSANAWGLHGMSGNVWEWTWDWYDDVEAGSVTDPQGPSTGTNRVVRSGSFHDSAEIVRVAVRGYFLPSLSDGLQGFRIALPE